MPRRRTPLSKERVLRGAVALADADGLDAVSMRRLARKLGVEAMSLYNHVANKDEILSGIADLVAAEIETPSDTDWKAAIRRSAISSRDAVVRHPWVSNLWMSSHAGGPTQLRREDWMLRTLREAGLPSDLVYHALHILRAYLLGFTQQQLAFPYEREEMAGMAQRFLERFPVDDYPDFAEHVRQHLDPPHGEGGFELGLDLLLDGLERARDGNGRRRRTRRDGRQPAG